MLPISFRLEESNSIIYTVEVKNRTGDILMYVYYVRIRTYDITSSYKIVSILVFFFTSNTGNFIAKKPKISRPEHC